MTLWQYLTIVAYVSVILNGVYLLIFVAPELYRGARSTFHGWLEPEHDDPTLIDEEARVIPFPHHRRVR